MKKKYEMEIPLSGYFWCQVEAEDKEAAYDAACELFGSLENIDESTDTYALIELEALQKVVEGNMFHGSLDEWSCVEVKDEGGDTGTDVDP